MTKIKELLTDQKKFTEPPIRPVQIIRKELSGILTTVLLGSKCLHSWQPMNGHRCRAGDNILDGVESVYETIKWIRFSKSEREIISTCIDHTNFYYSYFLRIPPNGFIDRISTWSTKFNVYNVDFHAYSLYDNQSVIVNDEEFLLNGGDLIKFDLRLPHQIKRVNTENIWYVGLYMTD